MPSVVFRAQEVGGSVLTFINPVDIIKNESLFLFLFLSLFSNYFDLVSEGFMLMYDRASFNFYFPNLNFSTIWTGRGKYLRRYRATEVA